MKTHLNWFQIVAVHAAEAAEGDGTRDQRLPQYFLLWPEEEGRISVAAAPCKVLILI